MTFDELIALTPAGIDQWTAPGAPPTDERVVFGGLVVAQAIVAASENTRRLHALHAFFVGTGEKLEIFDISIERTRDGGSFATRHVEIRQQGRLLLAGYSSHHDGDEGPEHQITMPKAPPPESAESFSIFRMRRDEQLGKPRRQYVAEQMLDIRYPEIQAAMPQTSNAPQIVWFKSHQPIAGSNAMHQAAIAFASDFGLVHVGVRNHLRPGVSLQTASLDHSIWFHREARADEWLLYSLHSEIVRNGRGLSRGSIFNRKGELVATVAQEFLARNGRPKLAR